MAKIIFSPLIASASGKAADAVFARWKGTNYVRQRVTPANPKSAKQTAQREALARCLIIWRAFEQQIKDAQDLYATNYGMSGYNWFMGKNVTSEKELGTSVLTPLFPPIDGPVTFALTSTVASTLQLDWTGGMAGADYDLYALVRKVYDLPGGGYDTKFTILDKDTTQWDAETFTSPADYTAGLTYMVIIACERIADHQFSFSMADTADCV